jgi:hypothetical protein
MIQRSGLVAADYSSRLGADAGERNRKSGRSREAPAARDGENYRYFGDSVKGVRRDDQDRTAALLLVSFNGIKSHYPDFTTPH